MGTRSKRVLRCARCRMHQEQCLCAHMPRFDVSTRLCLVMHCREVKKPSATGPMALSILSNSELYVHGLAESPLDLRALFDQGRRVLLLYPEEDAAPLDVLDRTQDSRPISLVVPDGNWRQASRAARRIPGLAQAEKVALPAGQETKWGIRRETKDGGLATFEAIARALGCLESPKVAQEMERYFARVVETTLRTRGNVNKVSQS